jgi:cytochrome c5
MKKSLPLALALVALSALLAACGGSSSTENTGSPGLEESPAEAVESEGGKAGEEAAEEEKAETESGSPEGKTGEGAKGSVVPNEGETESPKAGQKPGGEEGKEVNEGGSAALAAGKKEFQTNCSTCHTLVEAGAKGEVGPNLDELKPGIALVKKQVTNGGGAMPAFKGVLTEPEIDAVAAYVSRVAGTGNSKLGSE